MPSRHETLVALLREVHKGMYELVREAFDEAGLSSTSMAILRRLHERPGSTVSDLARSTGMAKSYISKTLEHLTEQLLVEKRADPADHRLTRIYRTEYSRSRFQEMEKVIHQRLAPVFALVPDDKVDATIEGLELLKVILDQRKTDRLT